MKLIQQGLSALWRFVDVVVFTAMSVMIALVFINAVLRYGFHSGVLASAEISRFLFVWIILLGAIVCLRDNLHLDMRMLEFMLPDNVRVWQQRFVYAVIGISSGMLFIGSARQTIANWPNISPLSGIPVGMLYLAGAVSGGAMAVIAAYRFIFPPAKFPEDEEGKQ
ncbi:TRAP transporter small permease [Cohaesibacter celericrescens]|nr:TRAP transporter small permease subunit [Cohaesibacter celericrescens]